MIEAVPNVSEGRDASTIERIAQAVASNPDVLLLGVAPDPDHHRTVYTYVSDSPDAIRDATLALFDVAVEAIDLRGHHGEHPRCGAVDVVPFVPLAGHEMSACVAIAEQVGQSVARKFGIPVYLYEHAARHENRRELPAIRKGGYEGFFGKIRDEAWQPDFGPATVHPTAGVTIIGARRLLIAFNVQLEGGDMSVAREIARTVRASNGGLPCVRAIAVDLRRRGVVQVSLNLVDFATTSMREAFDAVLSEARKRGVDVRSSEIIGFVPADAWFEGAETYLRLERFSESLILENRIAEEWQKAEGRK